MTEKINDDAIANLTNALDRFSKTLIPDLTNPTFPKQPDFLLAYFAPGIAELTQGMSRLIKDRGADPTNFATRNIWEKIGKTFTAVGNFISELVAIWG